MAEISYFWHGEVTGDATEAPYTNDEISDVMRQAFQFDRTYTLPAIYYYIQSQFGKFPFRVTLNSVSMVARVAPGTALVDGKLYWLANVRNFSMNEAGYYRIVLRKTFPELKDDTASGQTIRMLVLYSQYSPTDAEPEPTRTDDEYWEVTLAKIYSDGSTLVFDNNDPGGIDDELWSHSFNASSAATEYGNRLFPEGCINIPARIGGDPDDWSTPGDTKYVVPLARIEVGSVAIDANPKSHTFAEPFADAPIVVLTPYEVNVQNWSGNNLCISAISNTGFSIRFDDRTNLDYVHYVAIGRIF